MGVLAGCKAPPFLRQYRSDLCKVHRNAAAHRVVISLYTDPVDACGGVNDGRR